MARRGSFEGWSLFGWIAAAVLGMSAAVLAAQGTGEDGLRLLIRATARSSLLLFGLAFSASALRRLWRSEATGWLLRNRRQLGVGFAVSHAVHLVGIVAVAQLHPENFETSSSTLVVGGLAYLFIALMAATSSDAAFAWLGRARWQALHLTGGWLVWFVFATSYFGRLAGDRAAFYAPFAAAVALLAALRGAAWVHARSARRARAS